MKNHTLKIFVLVYIFLGSTYQKMLSQSNPSPILRLEMNKTNFNDETVFYFQQGGTTAFQPAYDAYKLFNSNQPYIGSLSGTILTSISGLPELTVNTSVPVKAITPSSGTFTFSALLENFPKDICVTLYDVFTGITTNMLTNNYTCVLHDTTASARFIINFYSSASTGITGLRQPNCDAPNGGIIFAKGSGSGPWNFEWKRNDSIIKTSPNKFTFDSLNNLNGGDYSLKITDLVGCAYFEESFSLKNVLVPTSDFEYEVNLNSGNISFTNNSINAQLNSWEFGDNSGTCYIPSPSHIYASPGVYTVTLNSESITNCKTQLKKAIQIIAMSTGISQNFLKDGVRLAYHTQGNYELLINFDKSHTITILLVDISGNLISHTQLENITSTIYPVNIEGFNSGNYLIKVMSDQNTEAIFKLVK